MPSKYPKVNILLPGYVSVEAGGRTCSTITLVQNEKLNIIVDPGTIPNERILRNALKKQGLSFLDINLVFLTHSHLDHFRNLGLFKNADVLDYWGLWQNDRCLPRKNKIDQNIRILETPGHSSDSLSMQVKTEAGVILICGDLFWKENFPTVDKFASDQTSLTNYRERALKESNFIIPGHGDIYKVAK